MKKGDIVQVLIGFDNWYAETIGSHNFKWDGTTGTITGIVHGRVVVQMRDKPICTAVPIRFLEVVSHDGKF